ncbi:MAG: DHHA1 domain-containing protein, partial [Oscillospiraceae bacterium]|nr:DHHA1 domain-containing protein [Oscillospiraceae bacterium]
PAVICVDEKNSLARNMIEQFKQAGFGDDFWSPEALRGSITKQTLLIVVDTHLPGILESKEIYDACKNVVVIDHHRKMVGHIDNAVIFYHEPYASSASELVAELLPYIGDREEKPTPLEAQSLLAGIMLDTRNFALHTGVRTFEAAAYLRRMGAQTGEAKKLFSSSFESYAYKARLVTSAEIYKGCAVVFSDNLPEEMRVVIPQAANDLLTIDGVQASFVAVALPDMVTISARSMGEVNVQVVMEQLGGGGHHTMAGVQLRETSLEQAHHLLYAAIDNYRSDAREAK